MRNFSDPEYVRQLTELANSSLGSFRDPNAVPAPPVDQFTPVDQFSQPTPEVDAFRADFGGPDPTPAPEMLADVNGVVSTPIIKRPEAATVPPPPPEQPPNRLREAQAEAGPGAGVINVRDARDSEAGTPVVPVRIPTPPRKQVPLTEAFVHGGLPDVYRPDSLRLASENAEMGAESSFKSGQGQLTASESIARRAQEAAAREEGVARDLYAKNEARLSAQKKAQQRAEEAETIAQVFDSAGKLFDDLKQYNSTIMAAAFAGAGKPELAVELVKAAQNQNYLAQRNAIERANMRGKRADNALERMRQAAGDERLGDLVYQQSVQQATAKRLASAAELDLTPSRREAVESAYRFALAEQQKTRYDIDARIATISNNPALTQAYNVLPPGRSKMSASRVGERAGIEDVLSGESEPESIKMRYDRLRDSAGNDPRLIERLRAQEAAEIEEANTNPELISKREKRAALTKVASDPRNIQSVSLPGASGKKGSTKGSAPQNSAPTPTAAEQAVYGKLFDSYVKRKMDGGITPLNMEGLEMAYVDSTDSATRGKGIFIEKGASLLEAGGRHYIVTGAATPEQKELARSMIDPNRALREMKSSFEEWDKVVRDIRSGALTGKDAARLYAEKSAQYDARRAVVVGERFKSLVGTPSETERADQLELAPKAISRVTELVTKARGAGLENIAELMTPEVLDEMSKKRGAVDGYVKAMTQDEGGIRRRIGQIIGGTPVIIKDAGEFRYVGK
jgi:hypothetical protein